MSKQDTYNINKKEHREMVMVLKMDQSMKIKKSNSGNSLYIEPSRNNLSERLLSIFAKVIDNNLQFLLFQTTKLSESLLETDRKEAMEEAVNFINSQKI